MFTWSVTSQCKCILFLELSEDSAPGFYNETHKDANPEIYSCCIRYNAAESCLFNPLRMGVICENEMFQTFCFLFTPLKFKAKAYFGNGNINLTHIHVF